MWCQATADRGRWVCCLLLDDISGVLFLKLIMDNTVAEISAPDNLEVLSERKYIFNLDTVMLE